MNDVKALILCNNPVSIPGIKEFLFYGKVGAIVVTKRNKEMQQICGALVKETGVPLLIVNRKDYEKSLINAIDEYGINVGLMMTFPYVLPESVWKRPAKGFINFHYGLLPQCRGPQPILRHLLNNDAEAGVTLHKVDGGIDTGEVIVQEKMPIETRDTYGSLQARLAYLAGKLAANLLKILSFGTVVPSLPQDESKAAYFEMPGADELTINWQTMPANQIIRLVNACNPWNKGAGTTINNWFIGITEAEETVMPQENDAGKPGTVLACNKTEGLVVMTMNNRALKINIVYTQEGFFSGHHMVEFGIAPGHCFE